MLLSRFGSISQRADPFINRIQLPTSTKNSLFISPSNQFSKNEFVRGTAGFTGRRIQRISKKAMKDPVTSARIKETLAKMEVDSLEAEIRKQEHPAPTKIEREELKKIRAEERKKKKEERDAMKKAGTLKIKSTLTPTPRKLTFLQTKIAPELAKAVEEMGWTCPTNFQRKVIPRIMQGKDIVASDKTGTGKTGAYVLPTLHQLKERGVAKRPKEGEVPSPSILVIAPTKELTDQVAEQVKLMGKYLDPPVKVTEMHGGQPQSLHYSSMANGVDVLVATPGRLASYLHEKEPILKLDEVRTVVLDECDRMLAMGHLTEVVNIWKKLPKYRHTEEALSRPVVREGQVRKQPAKVVHKKQIAMISATITKEIQDLIASLAPKAEQLDLNSEMSIPEGIEHIAFHVSRRRKQALLFYLIRRGGRTSLKGKQAIIFTRTIQRAERLAESMNEAGFNAMAIHKELSDNKRDNAIEKFKSGEIRYLVSTEVLTRGIDIPQLPYVVNFDVPASPQDFIHRIGRTGRAGATGVALTFVSKENQLIEVGGKITELSEQGLIDRIEKLMSQPLRFSKVPGPWADEPIPDSELSEKEKNLKELRMVQLAEKQLRVEGATRAEAKVKAPALDLDEHSLRDFEEGRYEDVIEAYDEKRARTKGALGKQKKGASNTNTYSRRERKKEEIK